jgi:hypothetical protein
MFLQENIAQVKSCASTRARRNTFCDHEVVVVDTCQTKFTQIQYFRKERKYVLAKKPLGKSCENHKINYTVECFYFLAKFGPVSAFGELKETPFLKFKSKMSI